MRRRDPRKRHMTPEEVVQTAEWIVAEPEVPSWEAVRRHVLWTFDVDRTTEALRRNAELQRARRLPKPAPTHEPPSPVRTKGLHNQVIRLRLEVERLEHRNQALFERNLRLINALRALNVPEERMERPIPIAHREGSEPPRGRRRG